MNDAGESRPAAAGADSGLAPGARLGRAREAQNLSAADVARQLKLSVWQIEALEAGRHDQLPGPIFVRGFIRNYARLVKLDPNELVRAATGGQPQAEARPEAPLSPDIPFPAVKESGWKKYAVAGTILFAALAVYEFHWNRPEIAGEAPVAAADVPPEPEAQKVPAVQKTPAATASAAPPQPAAPAAVTPAAEAPPPAAPVPEPRPRIAGPGEREIRMVFEEESWVEVRDGSNRTIFYQLNRAGTAQRIIGTPPLEVVVGNASGVKMTYSGKPVDLARHTKIDVARLTLE